MQTLIFFEVSLISTNAFVQIFIPLLKASFIPVFVDTFKYRRVVAFAHSDSRETPLVTF